MRSNVFTIMKKEFARFVSDKRLLFTTLIMPGLMIFIVYSLIGNILIRSQSDSGADEDRISGIFTVNLPLSAKNAAKEHGMRTGAETDDPELIKRRIRDEECDLLIIFPKDFDVLVYEYDPRAGTPAPNIEIYWNSSSKSSASAFQSMTDILDDYEYSIANKFDINKGEKVWDLTSADNQTKTALSSFLPLLLLLMMFSGCMSTAPESIAGEKERGTISMLLVTPVKRSEIAAGKILSLGVMAMMCGLSSAAGILLSLGNVLSEAGVAVKVNMYGAGDYLSLLAVVLSTVILYVTLISIVSAFAKSVKEATTAVIPLLFVNMLAGAVSMMAGEANAVYYYFIPVYNSIQCMQAVFASAGNPANILITSAANIAASCAGGFVLAKMFASERIIFNK